MSRQLRYNSTKDCVYTESIVLVESQFLAEVIIIPLFLNYLYICSVTRMKHSLYIFTYFCIYIYIYICIHIYIYIFVCVFVCITGPLA